MTSEDIIWKVNATTIYDEKFSLMHKNTYSYIIFGFYKWSLQK
jgi:hypothetical protein